MEILALIILAAVVIIAGVSFLPKIIDDRLRFNEVIRLHALLVNEKDEAQRENLLAHINLCRALSYKDYKTYSYYKKK